MSEMGGVDAGPLYVDVVANTTGFGRGLQEKINAEVARVKASITAEIDMRKAEAQLAAIARKDYVAKIKAEAQVAKAQADLDRTAAKDRVAKIKAEAQVTAALGALDAAAKDRIALIKAEAQTADAEAKLTAAETKRRVAQIQAEAQTAKAEGDLVAVAKQRIAEIAAEAQVITAQADLDRAAAKQRIAEIVAEARTASATGELDAAAKDRIAEITAEAQTAEADAKLAAAETKKRIAKIQADADVAEANARLDEAARDRTVKFRVDVDNGLNSISSGLSSIGTGALGLLQMPAIASGIAMAAGAAVQLAGGLVAVASAASSALGVLGAIPGLIAGAAQGIGTVITGFSGIGAAMKASSAAEKSAAGASTASASQREAAAQRIVAAQDSVKQAQAGLANTEANAARAIQQAQEGVARAHEEAAKSIRNAQQGVSTAEQQTVRDVERAQQSLAQAHQSAARDIATAEQQVTSAHQQAAQNVAQAERELMTAQKEATQAQLALVAAREAAARQLQDMNNQLVDQGFTVRQAQLDVQTADQSRTAVYRSPKSTDIQKQQADLSYEEAVQHLKEAQLEQQRLTEDTTKANKAGVEGSNQVTAAKDRLNAANQKIRDSEAALTKARLDGARQVAQAENQLAYTRQQSAQRIAQAEQALTDARQQGADRIAKAEQALTDARIEGARKVADAEGNLDNTRRTSAFSVASAQHSVVSAQQALKQAQDATTTSATKQSAAQTALAAAMANLSPAGRSLVTFLSHTLIPAWDNVKKAVQDALLPPVQRGLQGLMPLMGTLQTGMVQTARILGGAFEDLSKHYLATPLFKRDLQTIMANNNRAFATLSTALTPLARAFTDITVASGPLLQRFADFISNSATLVGNWIHTQRETGKLSDFFKKAGDTAAELWGIAVNLVTAIFNIGKAAYPAGKLLLDSFEGVTKKWADWTKSMEGQNKLKDYFDKSVPMVKAVGGLIHDIVVDIFGLGNDNTLAGKVEQIRTQILPDVKRVADNLKGAFGQALITAIGKVATALADLTDSGGSGALTTFVTTLGDMADIIDKILRLPGVAPVAGALAGVAGGLAAISIVLGPVVKGAGLLAKIGLFDGLLTVLGGRARVAAAGVALLDAAMTLLTGPVGLVVLAIGLIGFALYQLYQHWGPFHDFIDRQVTGLQHAFSNLGKMFSWLGTETKRELGVLGGQIAAAFRAIGGWFAGLGKSISDWWNNTVKPNWASFVKGWKDLGTDVGRGKDRIVGFFSGLGKSISGWWTGTVKPTWASVVRGWNGLGDSIGHGKDRIVGFFTGLGASIKDWWNRTVSTTWTKTVNGWNSLRDAISRGKDRIVGFFTSLGADIRDWWNRSVSPIWARVVSGWNSVRDNISRGVDKIKGFFNNLGQAILGVYRNPITTAFNAIKTALGKVQDAFRTGVDKIAAFWNGLKSAVSGPVRFVVDTIYNKGIKKFWDNIASKVGMGVLPPLTVPGLSTGGVVPAGPTKLGGRTAQPFATGGTARVVPGYAPGVDSVNAVLSPGEGVLVPEAVRGLARRFGTSAENAIQLINSSFSSRVSAPFPTPASARTEDGLPKFGIGGVFDWIGGQIGRGASAAKNFVGDKLSSAIDALKGAAQGALSGPLHAMAGPLHSLINSVLHATPPFMNVMRTAANNTVDKAVDWISGKDQALNAPAMGSGPAAKWQQLWAIVHRAFPSAQLFSAFRPGAITVSGNQSYHALGEAIDVTPSMAIFNWLASHYPRTAELIFSPAGNRQIKNGHPYFYTGPVRAEHFSHVHWALGAALNGGGGGLGPSSGISGGNAANKAIGKAMAAARGWTGGQWNALERLWMGESGWNNYARNPSSGAFGIPQALPASKMGVAAVLGDPRAQINWGLNYIKSVYGSPANAYSKWLSRSPHWYSLGGVAPAVMRMATGGVTPTSASAHAAHLAHLAHTRHLAHVQHLAQIARQVVTARPRTTIVKHPAPHPAPPPAHPLISRLFSSGDTGRQLLDGVISTGSKVAAPVVAAINTRLHSSGDTGQALLDALAAMNGRLFDSGGILRPGTTLATNATGQNEYILTGPQWDAVSSLAASAAVNRAVAHEPTAAERLAGAQIQIDVHPQPGTDAREVAREVAVEMGWLLR